MRVKRNKIMKDKGKREDKEKLKEIIIKKKGKGIENMERI